MDAVPPPNVAGLIATDNCDTSLRILVSTNYVDLAGCQARVDYTYTVIDDCGNFRNCIESWTTALTNGAPLVLRQPADASVALGGSAVFRVTAVGCSTLSYQWWRDGAPVPGAVLPQLSISPVNPLDVGTMVYCVISSLEGSTVSRTATLTIPSSRVVGPMPIEIMPMDAATMSILCPSENGVVYRLQTTLNLEQEPWLNLGPAIQGTGGTIQLPAPAPGEIRRYYRMMAIPITP
jgi:hypothetical protein